LGEVTEPQKVLGYLEKRKTKKEPLMGKQKMGQKKKKKKKGKAQSRREMYERGKEYKLAPRSGRQKTAIYYVRLR